MRVSSTLARFLQHPGPQGKLHPSRKPLLAPGATSEGLCRLLSVCTAAMMARLLRHAAWPCQSVSGRKGCASPGSARPICCIIGQSGLGTISSSSRSWSMCVTSALQALHT